MRTKAGPGSSPPARANTSDESFGSKKARSSFGRGFFKLRGGKQTASSPNLGDNNLLIALLVWCLFLVLCWTGSQWGAVEQGGLSAWTELWSHPVILSLEICGFRLLSCLSFSRLKVTLCVARKVGIAAVKHHWEDFHVDFCLVLSYVVVNSWSQLLSRWFNLPMK